MIVCDIVPCGNPAYAKIGWSYTGPLQYYYLCNKCAKISFDGVSARTPDFNWSRQSLERPKDMPIFKTEALKRIANGKSEGDKIRHRNDYNNALNYMTTWHREDVISQYGSVDEFMRISQLDS